MLTHPDVPTSFFGPAWRGGEIRPGDLLAGDLAWLDNDVAP